MNTLRLNHRLATPLLLWACMGTVSTQAQSTTVLDALTPAGLRVLSVEVPADPTHPVRLYMGETTQEELAIDVYRAESADAADERLAFFANTATGGLDAATEFEGLESGSLVAFTSGRFFVSIRRLSSMRPLSGLAARIQQDVAAVRVHGARDVPLETPAMGTSEFAPAQNLIGTELRATGSLRVRRSSAGWILLRSAGEYSMTLVGVDAHFNRIESHIDGH